MPAQQVQTILDAIRQVHREIVQRYEELAEQTTNDKIQLLLEDMRRRENRLIRAIEEYEDDGLDCVLDAWLQFVPEEVLRLQHLKEALVQPKTMQELVEETIILNAHLIDAYRTLAETAELPEIRDLFMNLAEMEEQNDIHYAKTLLEE